MKTNKFLILAIMLISALTSINAQSFHVYRNGGNVSDFTIADVDSIVFDAPEDEGTAIPSQIFRTDIHLRHSLRYTGRQLRGLLL